MAKNPGPLTLNPTLSLFSPLGLSYATREILLFTALSPAPGRVPGPYPVLSACFPSEWAQQGVGRNRSAQSPPLQLGDLRPREGL